MRVNQLVFNPLQPPVLLCASEDHNLYTFDMRNLSTTTQIYKGHVGACVSRLLCFSLVAFRDTEMGTDPLRFVSQRHVVRLVTNWSRVCVWIL